MQQFGIQVIFNSMIQLLEGVKTIYHFKHSCVHPANRWLPPFKCVIAHVCPHRVLDQEALQLPNTWTVHHVIVHPAFLVLVDNYVGWELLFNRRIGRYNYSYNKVLSMVP